MLQVLPDGWHGCVRPSGTAVRVSHGCPDLHLFAMEPHNAQMNTGSRCVSSQGKACSPLLDQGVFLVCVCVWGGGGGAGFVSIASICHHANNVVMAMNY